MKFMTYLSRLIILLFLFLPLVVSGQTSNNPPPVSRINPIDLQSGGIWNWHQRWDFGTENLVKNGRFEYWSFGTDTIPDGWSHSYAEVNCDVSRDTFRHGGNYSMRVTANGNDGYTDYRFEIDDAWRNRYLTLGFWYYCPETNDKTQKVLFSNNNPGGSSIATLKQDNAWHWAKLTIWCDTELSYVLVRVNPSYGATDTDDYLIIDEMNMHRGTLAPAWTRSTWDVLSDYGFFLRSQSSTAGISLQNYYGTLYLKNADQTDWAGLNAKAFTSTRAAGGNNNAMAMQHVGAPVSNKIAWKWSVRSNDEDLWLYGYDGSSTKNVYIIDWTDGSFRNYHGKVDTLGMRELASSPETPSAGWGRLYYKSDGNLYTKNDAGTETQVTSVTSTLADTSVKTISLIDTVKAGDEVCFMKCPYDLTLLEVAGYTNNGTCTINVEERAEGTPNTSGTNAMVSDLTCDDDQAETSSFSNAGFSENTWMVLDVGTPGGATKPTWLVVTIKFKKD